MQKILVPFKYMGGTVKLPFVLFVGWTSDERIEFANDLRKIKVRVDSELELGNKGYICFEASEALHAAEISKRTVEIIGGTLPKYSSMSVEVFRQLKAQGLEYDQRQLYGVRSKWLEMQIGMVDVPEFF